MDAFLLGHAVCSGKSKFINIVIALRILQENVILT